MNNKSTLLVTSGGLDVLWFDGWHPALDEALEHIPEREICSHELFRLLIQSPDSARKRIATVTEHKIPVAVIGLRQVGLYDYELLTWVIIPDPMFPAKPGYWLPVIEALGVETFVTWRRMPMPPPPSRLIRYMELTPVYQMRCSEDFEEYWRQSGHWNTVQRSRKRCRDFTFAINEPGAADWIIRNWGLTWEQKPIVVHDSILVANYLESQGLHYSFILLDQDKPVAGHTFMHHGNDLVWAITYRDPAYDSYGVGTRLMDLVFHWAKDAGFKTIDLGGRHDYKIRWAPKASELWLFNVCPEPIFRVKQAIDLARRASRKVTNWVQNI